MLFAQHFQHVAITHIRAFERHFHISEAFLQSKIGHQSAHHAAAEPAFFMAILDHRVKQLVAVEQRAIGIAHDETICVAIECQTHICAVLQHRSTHRCRVRRTALLIDVQAIGLIADCDYLRAKLTKYVRTNMVGSTMRAIQYQPHAAKG